MIGILLVAHGTLGESLIQCATHVLGERPDSLVPLDVTAQSSPAAMLNAAQAAIAGLDTGEGVLVLSDIYGATPCNTVCRLLTPGQVEGVAGVNLPMLLRALTYRNALPLAGLLDKTRQGGADGIVYITEQMCDAATGR
jgi:PTS system ascorbate-specific IIA component